MAQIKSVAKQYAPVNEQNKFAPIGEGS